MMARTGNFVFVGGTQGMGKAAALAAARAGCSVLLVARDWHAGEAAAAEMKAAGAREARFLGADLSTAAGANAAAQGIQSWNSAIHGLMHSAMSAFATRQVTPDGMELAFALQYLARVIINRQCVRALAASGDGRIVHLAGAVPYRMAPPALDDLQFEQRKWSFFKAILVTHVEGFMFLDEAARRWADLPVRLYASAVGTTKTKVMQDSNMPLIMRWMARFGTTPEISARNSIRLLLDATAPEPTAALYKNPKKFVPSPFGVPAAEAARLWDITTQIAAAKGVVLP
jgi:NAD(P)-dependent dehydrogenase (short-subunit alcohol dehydrogenase family)